MKRLSWVLLLVLLCEICAAQTTLTSREFKQRGICLTQVTTMGSVQAWWRNTRET